MLEQENRVVRPGRTLIYIGGHSGIIMPEKGGNAGLLQLSHRHFAPWTSDLPPKLTSFNINNGKC